MRAPDMQAGVSRDRFGGWSQLPSSASDWRTQLIASRYALAPGMARAVKGLVFGGGVHE
jgi:hypothetical protein